MLSQRRKALQRDDTAEGEESVVLIIAIFRWGCAHAVINIAITKMHEYSEGKQQSCCVVVGE